MCIGELTAVLESSERGRYDPEKGRFFPCFSRVSLVRSGQGGGFRSAELEAGAKAHRAIRAQLVSLKEPQGTGVEI